LRSILATNNAKIEMKKQQIIEEKLLEKQSQQVYAEIEGQVNGYQNEKSMPPRRYSIIQVPVRFN